MFEVLLIDDEVDIRERMISMIEWSRLDLHLCAQAADGETARELYMLHRPSIIITDINIPITNGLELVEEFIKLDPELQIIVITGYNDFSYAQRALRLGVTELLLKPIFPDAINASLQKAVDYFRNMQKEKASANAMKKLLDDNIGMIRETFLANLLHSKSFSGSDPRQKLEELGICCPGPCYTVALAGIPRSTENYEAVNLLAKNSARSMFDHMDLRCIMFFDNHFRLNLLFSHGHGDISDLIEEALNKLKSHLAFIAGVKLFAGIGGTVGSPEELYQSFEQALAAYRYQNILNEDTVIHYKNLLSYEETAPCQQCVSDQLAELLRRGLQDEVAHTATEYFTKLVSGPNAIGKMQDFAYTFLATVGCECSRQNVNAGKLPGFSSLLRSLGGASEPDDILKGILLLSEEFIGAMNAQRADSRNFLISKARKYMQENLSNSLLSMEDVSRHIGLSRAYFCALFHKEMGVSFSNYLKCIRIEEAKRQLADPKRKVMDIALATGFASAKYFSYVFKQTTGKTPVEFQKSIRK